MPGALPRSPRNGSIVACRTVLRRALFTKRHLQVDGVFIEIGLAASSDYVGEPRTAESTNFALPSGKRPIYAKTRRHREG
jgi:hypothetical protein